MAADPIQFRSRVLALDPAALKAGYQAFYCELSQNDITKVVKENPDHSSYTIQFPTGNTIHYDIQAGQGESTIPSDMNIVKPQSYEEFTYWDQYIYDGYHYNWGISWSYNGTVGQFTVFSNASHLTNYNPYSSASGCFSVYNVKGDSKGWGYNNTSYAEGKNITDFKTNQSVSFTPSVENEEGNYWYFSCV